MAQVELIMPKMGESVAEATIIKWLKSVGEEVELEEAVLEIATDKVDSEVPSPVEGKIVKLLFEEDDVVQVGQAIAMIETDATVEAESAAVTETPASAPATQEVAVEIEQSIQAVAETSTTVVSGDRFYSPLVRSIASKEGIDQAELDQVPGSGKDGRVTKKDILNYLKTRSEVKSSSAPASAPTVSAPSQVAAPPVSTPEHKAPAVSVNHGDEIIEMDRMRKLIAEHMVMSKHTSPHVTSFVEADVTKIVQWRNKHKDAFFKREGEKITFTPIFLEAIIKAIKDFPMINISVSDGKIVKKRDINVGMAAALPSGNLIVPVIHNADMYNLVGLTKKVNDLANRARQNKLKPDEIQGGTYTLTNVGTFGNVMGTPIINQPQVAIMAAGAIRKKAAVIETEQGDFIGIRHMMYLSHSYDHRVVDGALGGMFVRRVADYLEDWDSNREI